VRSSVLLCVRTKNQRSSVGGGQNLCSTFWTHRSKCYGEFIFLRCFVTLVQYLLVRWMVYLSVFLFLLSAENQWKAYWHHNCPRGIDWKGWDFGRGETCRQLLREGPISIRLQFYFHNADYFKEEVWVSKAEIIHLFLGLTVNNKTICEHFRFTFSN